MLIFVTFCERGDRAVRQRHTESVFVVIGIYLYSPDIFPFSAVSFFIDKCGIFLQHGIEITEECAEAFIAAVEIGYYKEFYRQGLITADELDILLQLQKKKAEEKKQKNADPMVHRDRFDGSGYPDQLKGDHSSLRSSI